MTTDATTATTSDGHALLDLMETEADALRRADFAALEDLSGRKEEMLAGFARSAEANDPDIVETLRMRGARNAALYAATLDGLRSVMDRLRHAARTAAHLDTYTAGGAMQDLGPTRTSFEKRS